jgi:hypothetical protein
MHPDFAQCCHVAAQQWMGTTQLLRHVLEEGGGGGIDTLVAEYLPAACGPWVAHGPKLANVLLWPYDSTAILYLPVAEEILFEQLVKLKLRFTVEFDRGSKEQMVNSG